MNIILFALSIIPSLLLLFYIKKQSNYSTHPRPLIIKYLCFGALSIIPVYVFEVVLDAALISIINNMGLYLFTSNFIGVALIEEFFKLLVLYEITNRNDKYFKTIYDGIIYSVSVASGFAIVEDLLYVFIYYGGSFETAMLRAVTPGHFCFSIFMGLLFSEAKKYENYNRKKYGRNIMLSLFVPTIIHGLYDYCLTNENTLFTLIFVVLLICLYIFTYKIVKKKSKEIYFI